MNGQDWNLSSIECFGRLVCILTRKRDSYDIDVKESVTFKFETKVIPNLTIGYKFRFLTID